MRLVVIACLLAAAIAIPTAVSAQSQVSVNIVDLFWNYAGFGTGGPAAADRAMQGACSKRSFTVIRFAASAFWPSQLKRYQTHQKQYLAALKNLTTAAANYNCTLIPSLFWNVFAPVDLVGEHLGDAMRNGSSSLHFFNQMYVTTAVQAMYDGAVAAGKTFSDVIHAIELGNELNLLADLDLSGSNAGIDPAMGTPTTRTRRDNFSTDDMMTYEYNLAQIVREATTIIAEVTVPISTGHAIPRDCAEHLRASYYLPQRNWGRDTIAQFQKNLLDTSNCCEYVSVHFYPGHGARFGNPDPNSTEVLVIAANTVNAVSNDTSFKALYVGEFGNENPGPRKFSRDVLTTMASASIPLGTVWIWEFYQFSPTQAAPYSLLPGRDDDFISTMELFNQQNANPGRR